MKKSELIQALADRFPALGSADAHQAVETVINAIGDSLASNGRVEIRNFGSFGLRQRKAMTARNPKTGQKVYLESKAVPFFKVGKELREHIKELENDHALTAGKSK